MKLSVYKADGSKTRRKVELDAEVFGITPNDHVLWLDVRRLQASRRQGTHKTKERSEVAGSTRKLYRQKGTGMARSGSTKSPLRRSGGRTFGNDPDCTPGYYNNEGQLATAAQRRNFLGFPDGPMAYFAYVDDWRSSGEFEGLSYA